MFCITEDALCRHIHTRVYSD